MVDPATDIDINKLADRVAGELKPGAYGDKVLLTRRQLAAIAGGTLSVGALTALGFGEAEAQQAVGQIGSDADRVDVWAAGGGNVALEGDVTSESTAAGYDLTVGGDTYQFNG